MLLTTLPSEQHTLGALMAEALCTLEGADCVALGPQTPVGDISAAAVAKDVDIVALSFSANFPAGQVSDGLGLLRASLPASVELWCGGAGTVRAKRIPEGVRRLVDRDVIEIINGDLGVVDPAWRIIERQMGNGEAAKEQRDIRNHKGDGAAAGMNCGWGQKGCHGRRDGVGERPPIGCDRR